ncbi:MAG: aldo/keto reductase [Chitinophagaceae bacterium]|nr:aldo/keto reductase [Chitinophagaceae bacterium]
MNYHLLGRSSLTVSEVGFGCMSLGSNDGENARLIHSAIDGGLNYFDTADMYQKGFNELTVGKALRGRRDKVILATKVGNQWRADGSGWEWNPYKQYIISAVEQSLKRLQTDYIDLYQLHGGTIDDPIDETIEAFETLQASGKIRYYGISSIRPNVIREYVKRSNIVSVMMQFSLLDRRPEETCLPLLRENDIALLVRGALAGGLLVNNPAKTYLQYAEGEVHKAQAAIQAISGINRKPAQTAIRFVLQQKNASTAVIGIRTMEQLKEMFAVTQSPLLTDKEIMYLRASVPVNYYDQHR